MAFSVSNIFGGLFSSSAPAGPPPPAAAATGVSSDPQDTVSLGSHTEEYFSRRGQLGWMYDLGRDSLGGCSQRCQAQRADDAKWMHETEQIEDYNRLVHEERVDSMRELDKSLGLPSSKEDIRGQLLDTQG